MKTLRGRDEITNAVRALTVVGRSDEFRRGVLALAETLVGDGTRRESWGLRDVVEIHRATVALLVQAVGAEFDRGVLSLVVALDEHADPVRLADQARALRERLDTATGDVVDGVIIRRDEPGRDIPALGDGRDWQDLDAGQVAGRHGRGRPVVVVFDEPGAVEL